MINWNSFKKRIGNKRRKYVKMNGEQYIFISYNSEDNHITVMKLRDYRVDRRILRDLTLDAFKEDFTFIKETSEKPIF